MATINIVTLQNLEQQLPQWQPAADQHLHAIVDMGSNGIRFSITSLAPPTTRLLTPIYSTRAGISLFDALTPVDGQLIFPDETITAVSGVLARFYQIALSHSVPQENIMILATEAMRRAGNSSQMLSAIAAATGGLAVRVLDPSVETLCGAVMGSRSGLAHVGESGALFLDLGGGSVQMTWVDTQDGDYAIHAASAGFSLPYGAAKLKRILDESDPEAIETEIDKLTTGVREGYDRLCMTFPRLNQIRTAHRGGMDISIKLYMCGGGFRGYGSMLMHTDPVQPYPFPSVNTYTTSADHFKRIHEMRAINSEYRGKILGLSKRRRTQFGAITAVIESLISAVPNIGQVTFCGGSNREGFLMMKLPPAIRESNPLTVLAQIQESEQGFFLAAKQLVAQALPSGVDFTRIPTVLSAGLTELLIRETWAGRGHDIDTNTSFALRSALIRDPDCPGLSHQTRAMLALALSARWAGDLCPYDHCLSEKLQAILNREAMHTTYWVLFVGALLGLVASLFPVQPPAAATLQSAISLHSRSIKISEDGEYLLLEVSVHERYQSIIDSDALNKFKKTIKMGKEKTPFNLKASLSFNRKS